MKVWKCESARGHIWSASYCKTKSTRETFASIYPALGWSS